MKNNVVRIQLHYCPKDATLRRKFGDLPLKYVRMKVTNEDDLILFEKVVKRYNFDLSDDAHVDDGKKETDEKKKLPIKHKKLHYLEASTSSSSQHYIENDDHEPVNLAKKRKQQKINDDDVDVGDGKEEGNILTQVINSTTDEEEEDDEHVRNLKKRWVKDYLDMESQPFL